MDIKITFKGYKERPPIGPLRRAYEWAAMAVPLWLLEKKTGIPGLRAAFYKSAKSGEREIISTAKNDTGRWDLDVEALEPDNRDGTYGVRLSLHEDSGRLTGDLMSRDLYRGLGVRGLSLQSYGESTTGEYRQGQTAAETESIRTFVNWFTAKPL